MTYAPAHGDDALVAVEIDTVIGDDGFLAGHPKIRQIAAGRDSGVVAWLETATEEVSSWRGSPPERRPEVELHGPGAPCSALAAHPRAEYAELYFDALGDPEAAPRGWWHALIWLKSS